MKSVISKQNGKLQCTILYTVFKYSVIREELAEEDTCTSHKTLSSDQKMR